jgi:hypothetical protein
MTVLADGEIGNHRRHAEGETRRVGYGGALERDHTNNHMN